MSLDTQSPSKGEVAFTWFNNYSGVAIKTPSKTLVLDPADIDPNIFKTVDAILVTHEHSDHFDENIIREIHQRTHCMVLADSTSANRLRDSVPSSKLQDMRVGKEVKVNGVAIRAGPFRHPAAAPVSYLITTEDGVRIYHTGDSLPNPGMKQIGDQSPPDIVFCTVGAPAPGASPQSGLEIVRMVKPKVAVPYHAPLADRKKFAELISKEAPTVKCMIVELNKPVKYP